MKWLRKLKAYWFGPSPLAMMVEEWAKKEILAQEQAALSAPIKAPAPPLSGEPYGDRPQQTLQVLGMVQPSDKPVTDPARAADLFDPTAQELAKRLRLAQAQFLLEHHDLAYTEKTYVVLSALADLMAEWGCSMETLQHSQMDIPGQIYSAVGFVQARFAEKQKNLYGQLGQYVH